MPAALYSPAMWRKVRTAYTRGEGSAKQLAARFGVSFAAVNRRACRERWADTVREVSERVVSQVSQRVTDATADALAGAAIAWRDDTLARMARARGDVDASRKQYATDPTTGAPVMDMPDVQTMLRAEQIADDVARRSLGLPLGDAGRLRVAVDGQGGVAVQWDRGLET